ncbi:MAG TPA: hypothetical protein VF857_05615 [Spirochaetota bacterium]
MEIRNDVSVRIQVRPVSESPRTSGNAIDKVSLDSSPSSGGFSSELRELSNVMTLMQTANGIIQEALNVSGKLRSIAMSSLADGPANTNEIAQSISEIRTSLQQNGGQPVSMPPIQQTGNARNNPGIPQIADELDQLSILSRQSPLDDRKLFSVEESLRKKQADTYGEIEQIGQRMGGAFSYGKSIASVDETSAMVKENPSQSLLVQGNIRPEIVSSLL